MNRAATHSPTKSSCQAFHTVALAGLLTLAFITPATAADFPGRLKGATISEAQTTNQLPVATFTHTQNGDTITLNANGSTDPDGSITRYKWDFNDGTVAEGVTTTRSITNTNSLQVTLTIFDDNNGVTLTQRTISAGPEMVKDTFSTDSSTDYTAMTGTITVSDGVAHGKPWNSSRAFHNTPLQSNDHFVEANVQYSGGSDSGGLMARVDSILKTCYISFFSGGKIILARFNGTTQTWMAEYNGNYSVDTYKIRLEAIGNNIKIYVNDIIRISKTDNNYNEGKNIGFYFNRGNNTDVTIDNLYSKKID